MDRSFLTNAEVVAASRKFVCIRLATYEDQKEADFMKSLYLGRSGQLENTTFAILSPDGKRKLARSGRGPHHQFRGASDMASGLKRIATSYEAARHSALADSKLPLMKSLDLALNVAAADNLPLIVTVADDSKDLEQLNQKLAPLAWSDKLAGQFVYASVTDQRQLKPVNGIDSGKQILAVGPDQFGLSGKVLAQFDADEEESVIRQRLQQVIAKFPRLAKDHNSHVRLGIQLGIDWESRIPETDPMSVRARERARGNR